MKFNLSFLVAALILITSCKKTDPIIPNEEELITTVLYTLSAPGVETVVLSFRDLDGDDGNAPIISGGNLVTNTSYTGVIDL